MRYTTIAGIELTLTRIPRVKIDSFYNRIMPPQPPTKQVEIWGGVEDQPVYDDTDYLTELQSYNVGSHKDQVKMVLDGIEIHTPLEKFSGKLGALSFYTKIPKDKKLATLQFIILENMTDALNVVASILYMSTVTNKAIAEAMQKFNVTWFNKPIQDAKLPTMYATRAQMFEDRQAAIFNNYNWLEFCKLSGYEQSECVAFMRLSNKFDYIVQSSKKQKTKKI